MQSTRLPDLMTTLLTQARTTKSGRSAHTLYGHHEHHLRQTVIALAQGHELAEHNSPGEATLQILSGQARLVAPNGTWDGQAGDHVLIGPARHSVTAVTDVVLLLTVAIPRD